MTEMKHAEHVTIPETWPSDCLEGDCEHRDEVCVDCMDEEGFGRDPEGWDDTPLEAWPHAGSEGWTETPPADVEIGGQS